jgi:hypothetical protein
MKVNSNSSKGTTKVVPLNADKTCTIKKTMRRMLDTVKLLNMPEIRLRETERSELS